MWTKFPSTWQANSQNPLVWDTYQTKSHRYTCTVQIHGPFNRGSLTSEYAVCFPTNFVKIHCLLYFPWTQNTYFVQLSRALLILYAILNRFSSHFESVLLLTDMFRTKWLKRFCLWRRKIRQHKWIWSNCSKWSSVMTMGMLL